jgi:DNA-binding transcriptional ArsR family regulator
MKAAGLDDVFVAIAHPLRRSLLDALASGEKPVNELSSAYQVSRPAISQHLRILLDAGLVEGRRQGRTNCYTLRPEKLAAAHQWISKYGQFWDTRMARLGQYLDRTGRHLSEHQGEER